MIAEGSIIGGLPATKPEYRVPKGWTKDTELLFYELLAEEELPRDSRIVIDKATNQDGKQPTIGPTRKRLGTEAPAALAPSRSKVLKSAHS
jgi:hypothetical protein